MEFNLQTLIDYALEYGPGVLKAIVVLIIGFWVIARVVKLLKQVMLKNNMDNDLIPFLTSLTSVLLKVLLIFSVAEMVGIKTTSFVAMLAAAGFAIGMALQGSLGNFASGVLLLLFKPYKSGDLVEIDGNKGWVSGIEIFNTTLRTATNQNVIIPNSKATGDTVINHSSNGFIRVDLFFAMPYEENFEKVKEAILADVTKLEGVLVDPAASVAIQSFESHNINVGVFLHCKPEDYWKVYYAANNQIKASLGQNNFQMAYSEGIELGKIGVN